MCGLRNSWTQLQESLRLIYFSLLSCSILLPNVCTNNNSKYDYKTLYSLIILLKYIHEIIIKVSFSYCLKFPVFCLPIR